MNEFFKYYPDQYRGYFLSSNERLIPILICLLLVLVVIVTRNWLSPKSKERILVAFGIIFIITELIERITLIDYFGFELQVISLHLCTISGVFGIYVLLTRKSERLFYIWFFWAIQGALQALIAPGITVGIYGIKYWQFYTYHILLIVSPIAMLIYKQYIPKLKDACISYVWLVIISIPILIFNAIYGTNFMFISLTKDARPFTGSILDLLGPHPWYMIPLYIIAFLLILLTYAPIHIIYNKKRTE